MVTTSIATFFFLSYAFECGPFDFVIRCGRISTRIRDFRSRRSVDHREGTRRGLISLIKRDEETPRRFPLAIFHASWRCHSSDALYKSSISLIETSSSIRVTRNGIGAIHSHYYCLDVS